MANEHKPVDLLWARREGDSFSIAVPCLRERGAVSFTEFLDASLGLPYGQPWTRVVGSIRGAEGDVEFRGYHPTRLVVCEQGPNRVVLRGHFDLNARGPAGEGLVEWAVYQDGAAFGTLSLRFITPDGNARLLRASLWLEAPETPLRIVTDDGEKLVAGDEVKRVEFNDASAGVLVRGEWEECDKVRMLVGWHREQAADYVGGKGPWPSVGDGPPYYEDWGPLGGQGWGDGGWPLGSGASVELLPAVGEELAEGLYLHFVDDPDGVELGPVQTFRGALLIADAEDESAAVARLATHRKAEPIDVQGGAWRGYAIAEGAHYVYAPDATELALTVPPADAPVAVHVYGLSHWGGWIVTCDGERIVPQLVNDGRGCDDPNGMQLGRFDDRFGPIIGQTDVPANRMILVVPPGGEARTVEIKAVEGLAISYLHWDDRQMYVIQSSANPRRNIAELHVRDGKLRRLVAPHTDQVSVAAMPLYWYQCNTPTSYYATDKVTKYVLTEAGPEAIAFEVHSRNKYGCAEAVYRVRIPFDPTSTRVEVEAELSVKKTWHFKDLQILNLFTEEFRDYRLWPHEFALAMHAGGGRMLKRPREGKGTVDGEHFSEYTPPLLYAQYTADRGNIFLAQTRMDGPVLCQHFLCPHWIDSHYHVASPTGKLEPGDAVSGSYELLIDDGREIATAEAEAVGRSVIAGTPLLDAVRAARG